MKVRNTLIFMLAIFAVIAITMAIFPDEGIKIGKDFVLKCPKFSDFLPAKEEENFDIDSLLSSQIDIDEHLTEPSLQQFPAYQEQPDPSSNRQVSDAVTNYDIEALKASVTPLEIGDGKTPLDNFFAKLASHGEYEKIRILHYGDSQLEGDRISAYIRYKFQSRFGGFGLGMCSPTAVYAQYSLKQESSENWTRYAGFGKKNAAVTHKKYGPMMAFDRFSPLRDSIWQRPETPYTAWLKYSKSNVGYSNTRKFKNIYIFYGNASEEINVTIKNGEQILNQGRMPISENLNVYAYKSAEYLDEISIEFEAFDSPDFYAISFEDDKGIYLDNIAMRGCSGEVFTNTDRQLLTEAYSKLGADLFIMQFGANAVPNTKDSVGAQHFANYFMSQVRTIKAMCPNCSIIVVGPNDMAKKNGENYETYPVLDTMVNLLRAAALKNNCAFWDTYKAMGGKNSMQKWVAADPPLAAKDYTHFSPQGAQIIANMLYNAIIVEYTNYLQNHKK